MELVQIINFLHRFVLLYLLLVCVQITIAQLDNACNHNEFRCADGSGCLSTEKLCNGIEDCRNGEDEKGNDQWDCTRSTLQTDCNAEELKCRLGGCISLKKKCDGKFDCWGGNDEAKDLCNAKPGWPRPATTMSRVNVTTMTTTSTTTLRTTTTTTQFSYPPHLPSFPSSTLEPIWTTSSSSSSPPLPSSPPATDIKWTSEQPNRTAKGCPPLPKEAGIVIRCYFAPRAKTFNCNRLRSPIGTEATHSCANYWSAPKTGPKSTTRVCGPNGWSKRNSGWRCSLKCGVAGSKAVGFIVGGTISAPNQWPWHVALYNEDPPNSGKFNYFCGGTLISRRAVMTAAHCATEQRKTTKRTDTIIAIPGKYHRSFDNNDASDSFAQPRKVIDIDVPDYYNSINYEADIAIMWLEEEVDITEGVRPCCLPHKSDDVQAGFEDINRGILAGWGRVKGRTFPEPLQEVDIPVVDIQTCRKAHPSLAMLIRSTTFCAGFLNGTTACDGDSGSGLIFEHPSEKDKWTIKGVVSAGIQKRGGGCDEHYFTVFTKVSQFREWIDTLLSNKIFR